MKKLGVLILGSVFFCFLVNGISLDMKEEYKQRENILCEIKGEILDPIEIGQIGFFRGHVVMPLEYDIKRIGEKYFIWAIAPQKEGNYTIMIKGVSTNIQGRIDKEDYSKNFIVTNESSDATVKPGFMTAKKDFEVNVLLNSDDSKIISIDFPEQGEITLEPGANKIDFDISKFNKSGFFLMAIGEYKMPVYIIKEAGNNQIYPGARLNLKLNPSKIESTMLIGDSASYPFQIINLEAYEVNGITLEYDRNVFGISQDKNITLNAGGAIEFSVYLNSSKYGKNEIIEEIILISDGIDYFELPIAINFTEDEKEQTTPYLDEFAKLQYCKALGGILCTAEGETCDAETENSLDGLCCLGKCEIPDRGGSSSWIGYLIAGIGVLVIVFIFLKYRKVKGKSEFEGRVLDGEKKLGKG